MYQLYILENWESLAQFCAIVAEQKTICALTLACGNAQKLQCDPLTSVSSLTSSSVRGGIHEKAFLVVLCLLWLVCSCLRLQEYSQVSDGRNAFALSEVDLFLGFWAALIGKGLG